LLPYPGHPLAPGTRYPFWSGLTGGFFLAMAYFGTDQSQVQRYLSGRSITESRLGLLFNGLFKVPMQALILFVGVLVFVFYQFHAAPLFFNESELARVYATPRAAERGLRSPKDVPASATGRLCGCPLDQQWGIPHYRFAGWLDRPEHRPGRSLWPMPTTFSEEVDK